MSDKQPPEPPKENNSPSDSPNPNPTAPLSNLQVPISPQILAQIVALMSGAGAQPRVMRGPNQPQLTGQIFPPQITGTLQQTWQGPYPPPEAVERYDKVQPGAFNRILSMAERMEAAQIEQSADSMRFQHQDTIRGQWLGFVTVVIALIGAGIMGAIGQPWLAGVFLTLPVMGVAKSLIESARSSSRPIADQNAPPSPTAANSPSTGDSPDATAQR